MSKQNREYILKELKNVLPWGTEVKDKDVNDLQQFIREYLGVLHHEMLVQYPHRAEQINKAYEHVNADLRDEFHYLKD